MATWMSKKVKDTIGDIESEFHWKYGTTVEIFEFTERWTEPGNEPRVKSELYGDERAKILFQALVNWIRLYYGEHEVERLLKNNPFDKPS